jgi:hypothetical protein
MTLQGGSLLFPTTLALARSLLVELGLLTALVGSARECRAGKSRPRNDMMLLYNPIHETEIQIQ